MISTLCVTRYRTLNRIATKAERIRAMIGFLCLLLTLFTYWISKKMYKRWNWSLLSSLVCPIILIALLLGLDTSYETYETGGQWLTELLKPATVAFAWPIYKYFDLLKKHGMAILLNVIVGSFLSVITSALLANYFQIDSSLEHSLAPHIVTTPMSQLTAVFVVLTALTGALLGPSLIRICRIKTAIAKGIMLERAQMEPAHQKHSKSVL